MALLKSCFAIVILATVIVAEVGNGAPRSYMPCVGDDPGVSLTVKEWPSVSVVISNWRWESIQKPPNTTSRLGHVSFDVVNQFIRYSARCSGTSADLFYTLSDHYSYPRPEYDCIATETIPAG